MGTSQVQSESFVSRDALSRALTDLKGYETKLNQRSKRIQYTLKVLNISDCGAIPVNLFQQLRAKTVNSLKSEAPFTSSNQFLELYYAFPLAPITEKTNYEFARKLRKSLTEQHDIGELTESGFSYFCVLNILIGHYESGAAQAVPPQSFTCTATWTPRAIEGEAELQPIEIKPWTTCFTAAKDIAARTDISLVWNCGDVPLPVGLLTPDMSAGEAIVAIAKHAFGDLQFDGKTWIVNRIKTAEPIND